MTDDFDLLARVALTIAFEPGSPALASVHDLGPELLLAESPRRIPLSRARDVLRGCEDAGIRVIVPGSTSWPSQLDDLAIPPALLYVRGAPVREALLRSVSVVGSRAATAQGAHIARRWSAELAESGISIVSGAAFGIDAAAHSGALAADGGTIAVLASGVDVASPRAHAGLLAAVAERGAILSELPPGTPPAQHRFLVRNRLIAALTPVTVVVQAAQRSGALSTARQAAELRRVVLAVPGDVDNAAHVGCNELIRQRVAEMVTRAEHVREMVLPLGEGLVATG